MEETTDRAVQPSRQWVGRAAFEAALIVLGIVGALVVDEWRDSRHRAARVHESLTSIRAELQANLASTQELKVLNEELIGTLRESAKTGVVYQGGFVHNRPLSSVAWESTRDAAITNDIDHQVLMRLGRAYGAMNNYLADVGAFSSFIYTFEGQRHCANGPSALPDG